jgi:homoserine dehydrogenase
MSPQRRRAFGVALLGVGTVGGATAVAFAERSRLLDERAGRPLRLIAGVVRDPDRPRVAADLPLTTEPFAVLDDPDVDVVVEVIGGLSPARDAKRELRFEAAVGGAIPIIAATQHLAAAQPRLLRGLVNGTTTYICSRMEEGASFDDALAEAQRAGYAEPDPTDDVEGWDAAYKLAILSTLLSGRYCSPDEVQRTSLRALSPAEVASRAQRGARTRYLAVAEFGSDGIRARVGPEEVAANSLEGQASGPTNVITLQTDIAGTLAFSGPGAGGPATASAILGDVIAIARSVS